jgi:tetratricopeptide (TPR) repeat protein
VPLLQRAIAIDPNFATAHAFLGRVYGDIGESVLSAESARKAYQLRDRASDPERFFITLSYHLQVTGDLEKAQETGELWTQTYPRDIIAHGLLSGWVYQEAGKYEEAIAEASKAIQLDPDLTYGYINLAYGYVFLNRLGQAEVTLRRASERTLEIPELLILRFELAFLKGDEAAMEREAARGQAEVGAEDWTANDQAFVLAYSGHLQQSRVMSHRAVELAQQARQAGRAAMYEAGAALREALFGNAAAASRNAIAALNVSKARDVEYGAALALALCGDSSRTQALANDLERRFPEDTFVRFTYVPVLHALLALSYGDPRKAIELLQTAAPYELGTPVSTQFGFYGALYPVYVRGEAYRAAHRSAEAAAEFQKILDHRGIVVADPIGALARLQLGRVLALTRDKAKAKTAYRDFLTLWKNADSDIPILAQARTEYATLQ